MARHKEFEPEQALAAATATFRSNGYEASGTAELLESMGIARQSMYDTFGGKQQLFHRCLEHYVSDSHEGLTACVSEDSPLKGIQRVFTEIASLDDRERDDGCMLLNAVGELGSLDAHVRDVAQRNHRALTALFSSAVRRAQAAGEVDGHIDPSSAGERLAVSFYGLRMVSTIDRSNSDLVSLACAATDFLTLPAF